MLFWPKAPPVVPPPKALVPVVLPVPNVGFEVLPKRPVPDDALLLPKGEEVLVLLLPNPPKPVPPVVLAVLPKIPPPPVFALPNAGFGPLNDDVAFVPNPVPYDTKVSDVIISNLCSILDIRMKKRFL